MSTMAIGSSASRDLRRFADETLGGCRVSLFVAKPECMGENEWIAYNIQAFAKQVTLIYSVVIDKCTEESCPRMTAGTQEFFWKEGDGERQQLAAPVYIDKVMSWVHSKLRDESLFPTAPDAKFPGNFKDQAGIMARRMFRVYAHIFYHHYEDFCNGIDVAEKLDMFLMTSFQHYVFFGRKFELLDQRTLKPMSELIAQLDKKEGEI